MPHTVPITAEEVRELMLSDHEFALLDVREEGEFGEGHMLHSVNVPYSRLELLVAPLVPRAACPVVLVDGGNRGIAALAARRLAALGYRDIRQLVGGIDAWHKLGQQLFQGAYVPSKAFGEWVEHQYDTPSLRAAELAELQAAGADLVVLDPRTAPEHAVRHVPQALSCPGAELVYRFWDLVPSPDTLVVVACGGRTRGILGAQTLIEAGVPNRVVALADGAHGWALAGLELERDTPEQTPKPVGPAARARSLALADALIARTGLSEVHLARVEEWMQGPEADHRTTVLIDVRSREEYDASHLPGARSAPGGQLIQATDQWLGTRNARVVLTDSDGVRSVTTALWLSRMGWEVHVLRNAAAGGGSQRADSVSGSSASGSLPADADRAARVQRDQTAAAAVAAELSPQEAAAWLAQGALALNVDRSEDFLAAHVPGSIWGNRARLAELTDALRAAQCVVVFSGDGMAARLAAQDLLEGAAGPMGKVFVARGGLLAWKAAGLPLVSAAAESLPQARRVDTLYWAHDRRTGNAAAMQQYLDWEKNLLAQVAADGFSFGPRAPVAEITTDH